MNITTSAVQPDSSNLGFFSTFLPLIGIGGALSCLNFSSACVKALSIASFGLSGKLESSKI